MSKKYWILIICIAALLYMCNKQEEPDPVAEYLEQMPKADPNRKYTAEELKELHEQQAQLQLDINKKVAAGLREKTGCGGVDLAVAAEAHIKKLLSRPARAEFSGYQDNMHGVDGDLLYYLGYVDAENGFGAMERVYFKVWMTCYRGDIVIKDVKVEQNS